MAKPTIKPNRGWTFHKDGTVSFFNLTTGAWERGDTRQYLRDLSIKLSKEV